MVITFDQNKTMKDNNTAQHNSCINFEKTSTKINLGSVSVYGNYLTEIPLFIAHFNVIPSMITESNIDCVRANKWFLGKYQEEIRKQYFAKRQLNGGGKAEIDDIFHILFDDLMIYFDVNRSTAQFLFSRTDLTKVELLIKEISKFQTRRNRKAYISLLVKTPDGIESKSVEITKPRLSVDDNYNNDFKEIHQTISRRLSRKNDKGLVLLHGKPGTGKTSYIRYLISSVKKKVIFLPPNMTDALTNPDLISILIENSNSVLVIEDAENIVIDRERNGHSPVSTILNISDGLLSDCLNIQIICSFNTDLSKVDSALMRKGRLIAKYEFKELEIDKAKRLSKKLGFNTQIDAPMTLTAIYNQDEKEYQQDRNTNPVGFRAISENRLVEN